MALEARNRSYCPYSGYAVGAGLLTSDGKLYSGCNIENAAYGVTLCAERTAIFKAVSEGSGKISMIAVAGGLKGQEPADYAYPCGSCRQVMKEFAAEDLIILVAKSATDYKEYRLEELLPFGFGGESIQ